MSMTINELSGIVIGAAIEVHKVLGPGLLESAYENCLCHELQLKNVFLNNRSRYLSPIRALILIVVIVLIS